MRALAELGAGINTPNINGTTVYLAAQEGHVASISVLAELRADLNASHNYVPLLCS